MKRPAFQFYPADWQKDPALRSCSIAARGLWIEMMCVLHQCEPYGHLSMNGNAMNTEQLARVVGDSPAVIKKLLAELEAAGVFSRNEKGCIYSRRMVKDEYIREVRAQSGRLGGNPSLVGDKVNQMDKQMVNQSVKQIPTPSSSSSSSISKPKTLRFAEFWSAYPKKGQKPQCLAKWSSKNLDSVADEIIAHVSSMAGSDQWTKEGGQFCPNPLTYLNQERWEQDAPVTKLDIV